MKTAHEMVLTVAIATALLTFSSQPSEAAVQHRVDESPSATVSASDLDLANPNDVRTLYERVRSAANGLCRAEAQREKASRRLTPFGWRQRCFESAVDEAIRNTDDQRLTALHLGVSEHIARRR